MTFLKKLSSSILSFTIEWNSQPTLWSYSQSIEEKSINSMEYVNVCEAVTIMAYL